MKNKVCIIGLGYIGLPTAAMFAQSGSEVLGVDVSLKVIEVLNRGQIHIEEPGLEDIINKHVKLGNFKASLKPECADTFIIAVPTPNLDDEFRSCDLRYVIEGAESIIPFLAKGNTVIIESTIAPKSMDDFIKPIFERAGYEIGKDLYLAHCPERVLPGQILHELRFNNRIVGGITHECAKRAASVYAAFVEGEIILTEAKTAELSKCMENTFRDVNIALANELARICFDLNVNCLDVIEMANKHPRVNIHQPGPGVGGHCLAIDPYFICAKAPEQAEIIRLSRETNKNMPMFVMKKIEMLLNGIENPKVAAFGMTYKGNVDDIRESPAVEVIQLMKHYGYEVKIFDPHVKQEECVSLEESVSGADLVVILTDHIEYKNLDHKYIAGMMRQPLLFDTRNIIQEQGGSGLTIVNYGNVYKYKNK